MKKQHEEKICPRCKEPIVKYPAISRVDNKTEICSKCGILEALQIFINTQKKEEKKWQ